MSDTKKKIINAPARNANELHGRAERVLVLGLGNVLLQDEGVGVHIAGMLAKKRLPAGVEVIDGGTSGLDVLLCDRGVYKLIVIDAAKGGEEPGAIYKMRFAAGEQDEMAAVFGGKDRSEISLHQLGVVDALGAARKIGAGPSETVIIGVEPGQMNCGLELSEQVEQKVPEIINAVLEEVENAVYER